MMSLVSIYIWGAGGGAGCMPSSGLERFFIILVGLASYLGQITLVVSAQFQTAAEVAILRKAFDVMFAFICQALFFHVSISYIFYTLT